jgi:hypothetical protein
MDVFTAFQLVLNEIVNPCHITSPWIQGTYYLCSTAVDTSQTVLLVFHNQFLHLCCVHMSLMCWDEVAIIMMDVNPLLKSLHPLPT